MVDADSILDPDALLGVAKPFADDPIRMVATGGAIRAANGCTRRRRARSSRSACPRSRLARIQVVEYLRAFLLGRTGWSRFGALILISGAFGMFRRDVLVEVGGLDPDSIGEDFELVMRIHRHITDQRRDYRVQFVAEPISWTEVPVTARVLRSQRRRWHRGLWETLWKYRGMLGNPRYGRVGLVALPYYWAFELFAPAARARRPRAGGRSASRSASSTCPYAYVFLARRLRLRDPRDARGHDGGGAVLPQVRPVARPAVDPRRLDLGERRLPPAHGVVAARGLVGRPHRQEAGLGHDDPSGLRRHGAGGRRAGTDRVARSPGRTSRG